MQSRSVSGRKAGGQAAVLLAVGMIRAIPRRIAWPAQGAPPSEGTPSRRRRRSSPSRLYRPWPGPGRPAWRAEMFATGGPGRIRLPEGAIPARWESLGTHVPASHGSRSGPCRERILAKPVQGSSCKAGQSLVVLGEAGPCYPLGGAQAGIANPHQGSVLGLHPFGAQESERLFRRVSELWGILGTPRVGAGCFPVRRGGT